MENEIKLTPEQASLARSIKKTQFGIRLENGSFLTFLGGNPFGEHYGKVLLFDEWGDAEIFGQSMELRGYHVERIE